MAEVQNKPAGQAGQPENPAKSQVPAPLPRQGNSGQDQEPGDGLGAALEASHKARTEVPGHEGVDARLDNRGGAARPPVEEWPAKPQQIDGPDLAGQLEHTRRVLQERESAVGDRKGQYSPGPHGLSDVSQRGGQAVESAEGWKD
jgi:hypothetical protein